jgi:hypothetical protein
MVTEYRLGDYIHCLEVEIWAELLPLDVGHRLPLSVIDGDATAKVVFIGNFSAEHPRDAR